MNVVQEQQANALILKVSGRIDSSTAPDFQSQLMQSIDKAPAILVDLAETDYMSSAGLRVVLMAAKSCKKEQRGFALCSVRPSVEEVLQMSGFLSIIQAYATPAEALDKFVS